MKREKDKELKKLMAKGLPKHFRLVKKCIQKSKTAWQNLVKKRSAWAKVYSRFIERLNKIENEFNKIFLT